jgi:hypothetical protein
MSHRFEGDKRGRAGFLRDQGDRRTGAKLRPLISYGVGMKEVRGGIRTVAGVRELVTLTCVG